MIGTQKIITVSLYWLPYDLFIPSPASFLSHLSISFSVQKSGNCHSSSKYSTVCRSVRHNTAELLIFMNMTRGWKKHNNVWYLRFSWHGSLDISRVVCRQQCLLFHQYLLPERSKVTGCIFIATVISGCASRTVIHKIEWLEWLSTEIEARHEKSLTLLLSFQQEFH